MTHTTKEQPELLPCPFCGTNPTLEGDGEILWIVCHADSACRRGGMVFAIKKDEMEIGINSWNLRAPAAQSQRAPLTDAECDSLISAFCPDFCDQRFPGDRPILRQLARDALNPSLGMVAIDSHIKQ